MFAPASSQSCRARACSVAAALIRTPSNRVICATIRANVGGTGRNYPGHEPRLCGHESHTATCGSHSAGMRKPSAAGVSIADRGLLMADFEAGTGSSGSCWLTRELERGDGLVPYFVSAVAYLALNPKFQSLLLSFGFFLAFGTWRATIDVSAS